MKSLKVRLFANNELRVSKTDLPYYCLSGEDKKEQIDSRIDAIQLDSKLASINDGGWSYYYEQAPGVVYEGGSRTGGKPTPLSKRTLTLSANFKPSDNSKNSKERKGYGTLPTVTRFSQYARHTILEAGAVFDRQLTESHQGLFLTFTLPGSRDDAYVCLAKWSGFVVNRVITSLRKKKFAEYYFYAWELQKRGALHLHLFIAVPRAVPMSSPRDTARNAWYSALEDISENTGIDLYLHKEGNYCTAKRYWQFDCQPVRKSAAAYISKYVSKGATKKSEVTINGERIPLCPHRWWGCSRGFKRLVDNWRFDVAFDSLLDSERERLYADMIGYAEMLLPVMSYGFNADIPGSNKDAPPIGHVCERIYYFPPDEWSLIHYLLRARVRVLASRYPPPRLRYKYFPWHYDGDLIDDSFEF